MSMRSMRWRRFNGRPGIAVARSTATTSLSRWSPDRRLIDIGWANAQGANGDYFAARNSLHKALEIRPDHVHAMALLVAVEIVRGSHAEAMKVARQVQKQLPRSPLGYVLEGDVLMAEKKFLQAAQSYEAAYALGKSGALVVKMHAAYRDGGKGDTAEVRLARWLEAAPDDLPVRMYAAESSLQIGKYGDAAAKYEWLEQRLPDNGSSSTTSHGRTRSSRTRGRCRPPSAPTA
jgi:tetratricopeptide (TPR) repeat protein